jgi:phosphoribosylformimino-5-aminoimidazole carboxamide ribotide isomerase
VRGKNIAIQGWQEQTNVSIFDFLRDMGKLGINQISVTDIERDGEMNGPSVELYREILVEFPNVQLVASGGISDVPDLETLHGLGCAGAIVGKAFFEGRIPLKFFSVFSKA